jgi:hypothetical protein
MTNSLANTSSSERPRRLDLRQQRITAQVTDAAQRKPGGHVTTDRNRCGYLAEHADGCTRWIVNNAYGSLIGSGEWS